MLNFFEALQKLSHNKTVIHGSLFSIFSFFNKGMAFVVLIVIANYITPSDYGKLSLFTTGVMFLLFFVALSTDGYISISYFKEKTEDFKKDFTSIIVLLLMMTCLIAVGISFFKGLIFDKFSIPPTLQYYALIIAAFTVLIHMVLNYYRVKEKIYCYGLISCSHSLFLFLTTLLFVITAKLGWEGKVYSEVVCAFVFGIIALVVFYRNKLFDLKIDVYRLKTVVLWGVPLIPHLASVWLKQGGDRIIINNFMSLEEVGLFSFALNLNSVIIMIGTAFNATNSVSLYKTLSSEKASIEKIEILKKQTKTIIYIYILTSIIITLGAYVLVPFFMNKYIGSLPYYSILVFQGFGQCIYFLYCNYLFYYHKNKELMMITFYTSVIHLILSFILTRYSLYYTCFIYIFTQILILIAVIKKSKKLIAVNLVEE